MKKIIALIIFALCLNVQMLNAKELKKTTKKTNPVLYDIPKVGKSANKNSSKPALKKPRNKPVATNQPESKKLLELVNQSKKNKNQTKTSAVKNSSKVAHNSAKKPVKNNPLTIKKQVVKTEKIEKRERIKLNLSELNYISFTKTGKTLILNSKEPKKPILLSKNKPNKNPELSIIDNGAKRDKLIKIAKSLIGTPYRYGSMNPRRGFDCSGFVSYVFLQGGIKLPRSSAEQFSQLSKVSKPQAGDLVFFRHGKRIGHVGMYLGNGLMVHSPQSGDRVKIESMEKPNWKRRYAGARKAISTNTNSMIAFK